MGLELKVKGKDSLVRSNHYLLNVYDIVEVVVINYVCLLSLYYRLP